VLGWYAGIGIDGEEESKNLLDINSRLVYYIAMQRYKLVW